MRLIIKSDKIGWLKNGIQNSFKMCNLTNSSWFIGFMFLRELHWVTTSINEYNPTSLFKSVINGLLSLQNKDKFQIFDPKCSKALSPLQSKWAHQHSTIQRAETKSFKGTKSKIWERLKCLNNKRVLKCNFFLSKMGGMSVG